MCPTTDFAYFASKVKYREPGPKVEWLNKNDIFRHKRNFMKPLTAYIMGWKASLQHKRMWLALYGFNLLLAFLAAFPLSGFLSKTVGQSLAFTRSLEGFDYTFLRDFLREYGQGFGQIVNHAIGYVALYLLLSILLMGGILHVFRQWGEPFRRAAFWQGCTRYFWRMLRLAVYFLLLQGLVLALFGFIFYKAGIGSSLSELETEVPVIQAANFILPLYLLAAILVFMLHDYAKIHVVHADQRWLFRPIWQAVKLVFRNFGKVVLLYLLNVASFLLLSVLYWRLSGFLKGGAYFGLFLLGQFFVIGRIGLKLVNLGSATWLYRQAFGGVVKEYKKDPPNSPS